jgi:phosphate-selective porin
MLSETHWFPLWEVHVKLKLALLAAAMIAAPALAQTAAPASDTVKAMIDKGVVMRVMDFEGEVTYTADGKFSGFDGMFSGTYTVDGAKLCTTSDMGSGCQEYPDGKKAGDTFTVEMDPVGEVSITIKQ